MAETKPEKPPLWSRLFAPLLAFGLLAAGSFYYFNLAAALKLNDQTAAGWAGCLLLAAALCGTWALWRILARAEDVLDRWVEGTPGKLDDFFYGFAVMGLKAVFPLLLFFYVFELRMFPPSQWFWAEKIPALATIFAIGWLLFQWSGLLEKFVLKGLESNRNLRNRGVVTRTRLLRRIAVVAIAFFTVASVLMLFEPLRHFGTSLLASAGVLGIVLGLAAQRTFGNLFAGIQIAFSQPVRIGDQVKIENEVGFVEEITLTFVVVRLWDLRRLVLPLSYFIENPFQNWTRTSTNIIGTVMISVDFTAPVEELRARFREIVASSRHWNSNTCALHVTDCDDVCMRLRLISSAATAGESFELQCEIREKFLDLLRREYPQALPRARNEQKGVEVWDQAVNRPDELLRNSAA